MKKVAFRRSTVFWTILMVFVFCFAVVLMAGPVQALPLLWLNPANPVASVGGDVDVAIQLDAATGVYGAQVEIDFDPAILQVASEDLTPGWCPQPDFVVSNSANNTLGTIAYAATQQNPTAPCNGGVVATVTFTCIAEGTSAVNYTSSIISNIGGSAIAHGTQNGTVECIQSAVDVIGSVALQNWPDPSGVEVTLFDSYGVADGPVVVGPDGKFTLRSNDMRPNNVYRVVAAYDRYLSAEASGITANPGDVIDLGLVTLRAGDINGDGKVNILDLTALSGNFYKESPQGWVP